MAQFVEQRKRLDQYHLNSFLSICIALGILVGYILTDYKLLAVALVILGLFLLNKILFTRYENPGVRIFSGFSEREFTSIGKRLLETVITLSTFMVKEAINIYRKRSQFTATLTNSSNYVLL